MTYQAYAGSTSPVAVTAGKGLIGVWCFGCTVFPPLTFSLYGRPPGGFEGGGSFAYSLVWFVLFNDTWSQKGHSVSCMTILFISKCKSADRTSGRT